MSTADWVGAFLGLTLTLSVFSYLLKDNALFRLIIHIFIGVTAALIIVIACYNVLIPQLIHPLLTGDWKTRLALIPALVLSLLLLTRLSRRISFLGSPVLALLVGVGAATAIGGVVLGTVYPQVMGTINLFDMQITNIRSTEFWGKLLNALVVLVGTVTTLIYFQFGVKSKAKSEQSAQPRGWVGRLSQVGQSFVAVAFGALFTGVLFASLVALITRLEAIVKLVEKLLSNG